MWISVVIGYMMRWMLQCSCYLGIYFRFIGVYFEMVIDMLIFGIYVNELATYNIVATTCFTF